MATIVHGNWLKPLCDRNQRGLWLAIWRPGMAFVKGLRAWTQSGTRPRQHRDSKYWVKTKRHRSVPNGTPIQVGIVMGHGAGYSVQLRTSQDSPGHELRWPDGNLSKSRSQMKRQDQRQCLKTKSPPTLPCMLFAAWSGIPHVQSEATISLFPCSCSRCHLRLHGQGSGEPGALCVHLCSLSILRSDHRCPLKNVYTMAIFFILC